MFISVCFCCPQPLASPCAPRSTRCWTASVRPTTCPHGALPPTTAGCWVRCICIYIYLYLYLYLYPYEGRSAWCSAAGYELHATSMCNCACADCARAVCACAACAMCFCHATNKHTCGLGVVHVTFMRLAFGVLSCHAKQHCAAVTPAVWFVSFVWQCLMPCSWSLA